MGRATQSPGDCAYRVRSSHHPMSRVDAEKRRRQKGPGLGHLCNVTCPQTIAELDFVPDSICDVATKAIVKVPAFE